MSIEPQSQDIYSEPKILKKKRKKDESKDLIVGKNTTEIIHSILPDNIKQLNKNLDQKVFRRHLLLNKNKSKQNSCDNKGKNEIDLESKQRIRRKKYLELEKIIKQEQKSWKYENFIPLHSLWIGYMSELLGLNLMINSSTSSNEIVSEESSNDLKEIPPIVNIQSKLLKADYHGSVLSVCRSKNPSLIDLKGIVVQETQETFKLITVNDSVKCIPKKHTVFKLELKFQLNKLLVFEIYGNQFCFKSTDRVGKKFKTKAFVEL
ncbi:hypothetical protein CROQUDRAFT_723252 [Cronartium quercuum f. sp. fusiforme G11]|uniref:Ribonuclease P protein subunit n=1 Tax=Cronartium quercuum f. sp. fusiforme G11 TaxID=708437 RepID=A0A9P6NGX2_9BASI|nr:hypothetical protein CROQUDRAFT_723252 [Cronartium quercuum f. sp. fusiforme G11]